MKLKRNHSICLALFFTCLFLFSANAQQQISKPVNGTAKKEAKITYKLMQAADNTWGYDIEVDKKLAIHQPHIPGVAGNEGFKTKAAAENVAKLVVSKMEKGEMPPTVTVDELKKLKAI